MVRNLILAIVFTVPLTHAYQIQSEFPKNNPASVTALLSVSCAQAVEFFEKNAGKILGDIPFVADARVMGKPEWKKGDDNELATNYTKNMSVGVTPTLTKEFPTLFIPATMTRQDCKQPKDGNSFSCTTNYSITFDGSQAVLYEKVIEVTKSQEWTKSFRGYMTFTNYGSGMCTFYNSFGISDNTYLWIKRKLIKNADPNVIEGNILLRFVEWAKLILPQVEGVK